ncbi:hypothetical protein HHK36_014942 [Tetracentron sinense]|uniref:Uncharacterized protein n=1 Tax=Tetracentron sinense TaxID=13715 RepID=A0A835DDD8_TETSI|nr:hypothetical protein HHK36_014942 [Tetracentron sinense]
MLGAGLQFGRGRGEDRFYNPVKARRNHLHRQQQQEQLQRTRSNGTVSSVPSTKGKSVISENRKPENRAGSEEPSKPMAIPDSEPAITPPSNLDQFLKSTTPSVPAQYFSKATMSWSTCDVEFQPYFTLGDLWEAFKEWSAYGAGVPLILDGSDCVVQYYVPYLSGMQIYGDSTMSIAKSSFCIFILQFVGSYLSSIVLLCNRRPGDDSDSDYYRDSSSDGSSDCEIERGLNNSREQWNRHHLTSEVPPRMGRLSLREKHFVHQEDFSSDDGEASNSHGRLLFEYFEKDPPYSREPLAYKASPCFLMISDLASHFPELKTLRSCDLLSASWVSVAWYPIYRIPTGPTLRDLDACFLTFHSLSTPIGGAGIVLAPVVTCSSEMEGIPKISLPVFGMASYKFKGSMWTPNVGCEGERANSLLQAADNWLRLLKVNHPDFQFFASHGTWCR